MAELSNTARPAEQIKELRLILSAIQREATNKGVTELIDLAERADEIAASLLARVAD